MMVSADMVVSSLQKDGFEVLSVSTGLLDDNETGPMITIDHRSYPGVEAHLFTAAHSAFWASRFDKNGDIVLSFTLAKTKDEYLFAWERLLGSLVKLSEVLQTYRERVLAGSVPGIIWAHHDNEWYRQLRNAPYHERQNVETFIDYVDPSIRGHIIALNNYGFPTLESCSGLPQEHLDRDPYRPYVMLDERAYPGCIPHFFTLADIADWIPSYAPHNFDVYIRIQRHRPIEEEWNKLVQSAKILHAILLPYTQSVRKPMFGVEQFDIPRDPLGMSLLNR